MTGGSVFRGHEGLRSWSREWYEAWESLEEDVEELIDAGDQVISVVTGRARGRASGLEGNFPLAAVWTIHEGRIIRVVWFPTRGEALEAVGLSE